MESESIGARGYFKLTQTVIRQLVRSLCRKYGTSQANVVFENIGPWSGEWSDGVISLNPGRSRARDLITVAHEFVHHLHEHIAPGNDHQFSLPRGKGPLPQGDLHLPFNNHE
jgi:hypothetical protein